MKCKIMIFNALIIVAIIFSCNKNNLDQPPVGLLGDATLATKSGVEGLLIGAYALLDGVSDDDPNDGQPGIGGYESPASNWIFGSLCGSEAHKGSTQDDAPEI